MMRLKTVVNKGTACQIQDTTLQVYISSSIDKKWRLDQVPSDLTKRSHGII